MKSMRISAMRWAILVSVLLVSLICGMVGAAKLLVDRCDSPEGWGLNLGAEYPGTQGNFAMEEMDGRQMLRKVSVEAALAWDNQYLYLLVVAGDNDHRTPGTNAGGGYMQLSPGIREGKDPSAYPDFYLGQ